MKTLIIAFMFITATIFPILFIPLWALTLVIVLAVYPYVTTHVKWFASKRELDLLKH
jgi:hypothetical protein